MGRLKEKTIVITGASRGIGLGIALRFAAEGANVVVLTKDTPEQMAYVKEEVAKAGGRPLVLSADVSDCQVIQKAIEQAVKEFGGIDALVNNTSATYFTGTLTTLPEKFDLVMATSVRAAFFIAQACIPHLKKSPNPHIINISPPINIDPHWFKDYPAFSIGKYGMSLCTLGMAEEFRKEGIAVNSLWPKTTIATQTILDHFDPKVYAGSRWPSIMGDAAFELISRSSKECTGRFFTDEDLLRESGVADFSPYAVDLKSPAMQALFIPQEAHMLPVSQDLFK